MRPSVLAHADEVIECRKIALHSHSIPHVDAHASTRAHGGVDLRPGVASASNLVPKFAMSDGDKTKGRHFNGALGLSVSRSGSAIASPNAGSGSSVIVVQQFAATSS